MSIAINVIQGRRILELLDERGSIGPLASGIRVPDLKATALSGGEVVLTYPRKGPTTILYIFRAGCVWCGRNADLVNSLWHNLSKEKYRLIGIALSGDGLRQFVTSHRIEFPVYLVTDSPTIASYQFSATPETIIVAPGGIVSKSYNGVYTGATRRGIEDLLSITFSSDLRPPQE